MARRSAASAIKTLSLAALLGWLAVACHRSPTEGCPGPFDLSDPSIVAPTRVFAPPPQYTEEARLARVQGTMVVAGIVDCDGALVDLEVVQGLGFGLDEATLDTLSSWRFTPATRNGTPVSVYYSVTITFQLQ